MVHPPFGLSGSPFAALRNDCSGEASSKDEPGARRVPSRPGPLRGETGVGMARMP
jgi:hypothetical protein